MKYFLIILLFAWSILSLKGQVPFPIVFGVTQTLDFSDTNTTKYISIDTLIPTNLFQFGRPQKAILNSSYSPPNSLVTDTINSYSNNNHSVFYMTLLKDEGLMDFVFRTQYDTDPGMDGGNIEISFDGGATWGNVIDSAFLSIYNIQVGYNTNFYTKFDSVQSLNGKPGFSGSSNGWINSSFGLFYQNAVQNTDTFLLKFEFTSDAQNTSKDGWAIDDVLIYATHVGISEVYQDNFIAFPNPSNGLFNIGNYAYGFTGFNIYNSIGQKLKEIDFNSNELIDLSNQETGLYIIVFYNENTSVIRKISVER